VCVYNGGGAGGWGGTRGLLGAGSIRCFFRVVSSAPLWALCYLVFTLCIPLLLPVRLCLSLTCLLLAYLPLALPLLLLSIQRYIFSVRRIVILSTVEGA